MTIIIEKVNADFQHKKGDSSTEKARVNYVALAALAILSLTIVAAPFLIIYIMTHRFTDETVSSEPNDLKEEIQSVAGRALNDAMLTRIESYADRTVGTLLPNDLKQEIQSVAGRALNDEMLTRIESYADRKVGTLMPNDLKEEIQSVAGRALNDAMLTRIESYADRKVGTLLPSKDQVKDARFIKNKKRSQHSITPFASDNITIDGVLVHGQKLGNGAFSDVKKGLMITKQDGMWSVRNVAFHKGNKNKKGYRGKMERSKGKGVYKPEIDLHKQLFGKKTHRNVESAPLVLGWLDAEREFMVHELRRGDMEHIPAESSQHLLNIAQDLADGLAFYHDQDVLFRDLKPANILMDNKGRAILSDPMEIKEDDWNGFGGTPFYCPAEYAKNARQTKTGDMYTLGVTLLDLKYTYLKNALLSSPNKLLGRGAVLKEIEKKMDIDSKSNTSFSRRHQLQQRRILAIQEQDRIINKIHKHGGFQDEGLGSVKINLAYLDKIAAGLLSYNPKERLTAEQVSDRLNMASVKAVNVYSKELSRPGKSRSTARPSRAQ